MAEAIKPIRVANEAFLVASTIERCPKTMMLRELVMNALEAARDGGEPKAVELRTATVDGVRKLAIWNTGTGLSAPELDCIFDLASSLRKTPRLDGNFGMGAKVASLPSNRHGMRFRSCRDGQVSEVTLGQRDGVYGRLPLADGAALAAPGVANATAAASAEGYTLRPDWTEVVLLGQRPDQDTAADPYAGNPASSPDWVMAALNRRFYRLPAAVPVTLAAGLGAKQPRSFVPLADRTVGFEQVERVGVQAGITLHYAFGRRPGPEAGCGMLVFQDEIYAQVDGTKWLFEAPAFGFPFAARNCRVIVELPPGFGVRPEAYRQFLRFCDGDQRQVFLSDFASLIRTHLPPWLRDIIGGFGPARPDYLGEIRTELSDLLAELGVRPAHSDSDFVRGQAEPPEAQAAEPDAEDTDAPPPEPPRQPVEKPPTIIGLRNETEIADKGLSGRAAVYHPATHELFVNLTYPAVDGAKAHLRQALGPLLDPERADLLAAEMAEALITRRVARAAVFGLAKQALGWTGEEVVRVQSPEALSLAADDYYALLPTAQRQLAELLGIEQPEVQADGGAAIAARQLATSLAEARQAAKRSVGERRSAGFMRRVSELELSRNNVGEAASWAQRAVAADPQDPHSHRLLAELALRSGALAQAEQHATEALHLGGDNPAPFLAMQGHVAKARGDLDAAIERFGAAAAAAKTDRAGLLLHLSHLQVEAGWHRAAAATVREAESVEGRSSRVLRRHGELAMADGDLDGAIRLARDALAVDPGEPAPFLLLTSALLRKGDLAEAGEAVRQALDMKPAKPVPFFRSAADVALQAGDHRAALEITQTAVRAGPDDPGAFFHHSIALQRGGDFDAARLAVAAAMDLMPAPPAYLLRRRGEIEREAGRTQEAQAWFERALAAGPSEPINYIVLSEVHQVGGDLDGAWQAVAAGLGRLSAPNAALLRRAAQVSSARGDRDVALAFVRDAVALEPREPHNFHLLSEMLQRAGDLPGAIEAQRQAVQLAIPGACLFASRLTQIMPAPRLDADAAK